MNNARRSVRLLRLGTFDPPGAADFVRAGFEVQKAIPAGAKASDSCDALVVAASPPPILALLLDLTPVERGLPVVCVTAATVEEEIALLDSGASLCLPLDVTGAEVMERTRHLLRLAGGLPRYRQLGDLDIDPGRRRAAWRGVVFALRPAEFDLLLHLGERAGRPVAAASLAASLWPGEDTKVAAGRLTVHLHRLRASLAEAARRPLLHSLPRGFHLLAAVPPRMARRPE